MSCILPDNFMAQSKTEQSSVNAESMRTGLSLVNLAYCAPKNASSGKCRHPTCGVVASHLMTSEMLSAKEQAGDGGPYWEHPNPVPTCEHPGWESDTLVPPSFSVMCHSLSFEWDSEATWWPAQAQATEQAGRAHLASRCLQGMVASTVIQRKTHPWTQVFAKETERKSSLLLLSLQLQKTSGGWWVSHSHHLETLQGSPTHPASEWKGWGTGVIVRLWCNRHIFCKQSLC